MTSAEPMPGLTSWTFDAAYCSLLRRDFRSRKSYRSKEHDERRPQLNDRQQPLKFVRLCLAARLCSRLTSGATIACRVHKFSSVGDTPRPVRSGGGGKPGGLKIRSKVSRSSSLKWVRSGSALTSIAWAGLP